MTLTSKLKVEFAAPENGWTKIKFVSDDNFYELFPSYMPCDSFSELLNALLKILAGNPEAAVMWNDELTEYKFAFTLENRKVIFRIYEITDSLVAGKIEEEKFSFCDSERNIIRSFWKGLRDMQSKQSAEEFKKQWRRPFPQNEMLELTQRIS